MAIQRGDDGRKFDIVTVPHFEICDNRDKGRLFYIKEWSASVADKWITRITLASNSGGGSIPIDLRGIGWEGIAAIGINTFLRGQINPDVMLPLVDELLTCVKIIRDPNHPTMISDLIEDADIQEVATRWWLRSEVVRVHTNFSPAAALSRLFASIFSLAERTSKTTPTSPDESGT